MSHLIVNNWKILKTFNSLRGAKIAHTRKYKELYPDSLIVESRAFYESEPMVETINLQSRKKVMIRASQKGSCTDPGTETYWSM
jgi:hypothetical protein